MDARQIDGGSHRFVPTAEGLADLFRRYEEERSLSGMASTLQRVSPRQRIDTIVTILGLNAAGGWRREDGDSAKELWLRYLTPVLAETRESAAALAFALDGGLPGAFEPPVDPLPPPPPPPPSDGFRLTQSLQPKPPPPPRWRLWLAEKIERLRFALAGWRAKAIVLAAVLAIALGVAWPLGLGDLWQNWRNPVVLDCTNCPVVDPGESTDLGGGGLRPRPDVPPDPNPDDPAGDDYRAALATTVAAVDQHNGSITPRALAQIYAGESDFIADPEIFLTAMLKRWPEDPDTPLTRNPTGVQGLLQYAAAFASLEFGRPVSIRPLDRANDEDDFLLSRVGLFNSDGDAGPARPMAASTWPTWLPWLAFLPLLPALLLAVTTFRPAVRASLTNPAAGARGAPVELPLDGLIVSAPAPRAQAGAPDRLARAGGRTPNSRRQKHPRHAGARRLPDCGDETPAAACRICLPGAAAAHRRSRARPRQPLHRRTGARRAFRHRL